MKNETTVIRLQLSGGRDDEARLLTFLEELECAGEIEPGAIADAWIIHDGWCAVWHGHPCNCNAAIEISVRVSPGPDDGEKYPEKAGTGYAIFQSQEIAWYRTLA